MKIRHLNILPPTLLLALSALLSRFLGIFRDHLLAKTFGATGGTGIHNLDTYYAAFRIPDMLYNLLIFGAISAAFIPIFTQYKKDGKLRDAWEFASSMLHLMIVAILIISGVAYLFAPYLVQIVAGGFEGEQLQLTIKLMRILLLSPIIFSITSILISIQDSFKTFLFRSLGPLFYNLGIIAGILLFAENFGVVGVVWGVILGAVMDLFIQLPSLRLVNFKHYWLLGYKREDVKKAFKLILPRILGLSMTQLTLIINTLIASFLMTGSITVFYLSDNLQAVPLGMIGISFAITSFATLSELASDEDKEPFAIEIRRVIGQILFLIIPATIGMLMLRHEIIDVILKYGKFSESDALLTASVLGFLLISLFAQSLIPILGRGFYAYHNTKTPVISGIVGSIISIIGSLILAIGLNLGIIGVAIAFSVGSIINFALLYVLMHKHLQFEILNWVGIIKMLLISTIMGSVVSMTKLIVPFSGSTLTQIGLLILYTIVGLLVYMLLAAFLRLHEFQLIWRQVKRLKE